jgi:hypothetical protein
MHRCELLETSYFENTPAKRNPPPKEEEEEERRIRLLTRENVFNMMGI